MLLLYYNPTTSNYYLKYYKRILNGYRVGYSNQFNHTVVKMLIITPEGLIDVKSSDDYYFNHVKGHKKVSLKKRIVNRIVDFLYKI